MEKYQGLERITSTDKTIAQMLMQAYDLGMKYGSKETLEKIAREQSPLALNTGVSDMSSPPPDYRVILSPRLKVIRDLCPDKVQIRHTVRSMQRDSYNVEWVLYTTAPVSREDTPSLVYEMLRTALETEANSSKISKESYYKREF